MQLQREHYSQFNEYPPLLLLSFIFVHGHPDWSPPSSHFKTAKHKRGVYIRSPESLCIFQLYRKYSDMTARVTTPAVEGTSVFVGHGKIRTRGWREEGKGFPALLKSHDPIFQPLFWEIPIFLSVSEGTCGKFLKFLLILVTHRVFSMFFYSSLFL